MAKEIIVDISVEKLSHHTKFIQTLLYEAMVNDLNKQSHT